MVKPQDHKKKNPIISSVENKRTFNYQKDTVSLNFTLNLDKKQEVKNFIELLKVAALDVEKTL